jgi:hypothetical protein
MLLAAARGGLAAATFFESNFCIATIWCLIDRNGPVGSTPLVTSSVLVRYGRWATIWSASAAPMPCSVINSLRLALLMST